jgi:8-oxo-dGTP pyrophosphatase MutT (NUDIX family)
VPRDAATVVLVRQAPDDPGFEAFLLRRTRSLEFAPGACVFPGGSVDADDADPAIDWAGPSPADFGDRLGTSADRARALVCAAVRETFEESGVLLAGPSPAMLPRDSAALARDRHALLDGSVSLAGLLARRGLVLRADLLTPWARWITPEVSPRRFDTWFFVAALPPGQAATHAEPRRADPVPGESDSGTWLRPSAALDAARAGEITLMPPTAVTLSELAGYRDVDGILAGHRAIVPLMPEVTLEDGRAWLSMPHGTEYPL